MVVVEVPVETPKVRKPKSESKKLITKKPLALAKKTVSKPAALPGDRPEPILTNDIVPVYPKQALNNEWEGQVEVSVEVDATGKPIRVSVISSSGHPILDQAFVRTIQELYTFKPKREGGKDVSGTKRLSYTYKLQ